MRTLAPLRRTRSIAALACVLALALFLGGCGKRKDEIPKPTGATPQERSQALIDAGNQAFRGGNYGLAARRYAAAAVEKNDDPAAYYGLGMALAKLGRDEEARKAYARARELNQKNH